MSSRYPLREIRPQDIRAHATADGHDVLVTDDLLRVGAGELIKLDVRIEEIRRIQFDIDRDRPATLVIVPDSPSTEPQMIMVLPDDIESVARALAVIGKEMADRKD